MDFYKKIVKTRDPASILSEKEYKCVSLQAIINEAIKENNKITLKELVDEINEHLVDLKTINKDEKNPKLKAKCETLIRKYEECLAKVTDKRHFDLTDPINRQLQQFQSAVDLNIKEDNIDELTKLSEILERNIAVLKEIPEVKSAKSDERYKNILEVVNNYTSLLNKVLLHIKNSKRIISGPTLIGTVQSPKNNEENTQAQKLSPQAPKKVNLNEVEEKLRQMRQKRLSRLSTFVDQQTKLSEQRSRENSPKSSQILNKGSSNLSQVPEKVENEMPINTARSPDYIKPSLYKAAAHEKLIKEHEQKVFVKTENLKDLKGDQEKIPTGFVSNFRNSFGKGNTSISFNGPLLSSDPKSLPQPLPVPRTDYTTHTHLVESNISIRSFAERQIENAKNKVEKPKLELKSSNSSVTPPKTPTQIRKIFNSFNSCVLGRNNNKSIEDLPNEYKSVFEKELKNVQLKTTALERCKQEEQKIFQDKEIKFQLKPTGLDRSLNTPAVNKEHNTGPSPIPVQPPRINKPLEKPVALSRKAVQLKTDIGIKNEVKIQKGHPSNTRFIGIEKSASQSHIDLPSNRLKSKDQNIVQEEATKKSWRKSLDLDSIAVQDIDTDLLRPKNLPITIKRNNSNAQEPSAERCSFSTFRTSTDSAKEIYVENSLYGVIGENKVKNLENTKKIPENSEAASKTAEEQTSQEPTTKINRHNSMCLDSMLLAAKAREVKSDYNILENFDLVDKKRRMSCRRENTNKLKLLESIITSLEYAIKSFTGLKMDEDYSWLDKILSKYYVKVDEVPIITTFEKLEKNVLLERLKKANKDLQNKVTRNEVMLKMILEDQVKLIADNHGIV